MTSLKNSEIFSNVYKVVSSTDYFIYFFIGGRGWGKTYSMLKGMLDHGNRFIYLRTIDDVIENCVNNEANPFKDINIDDNRNIVVRKKKSSATFVDEDTEEIVGYAYALNTFYKQRGSSFPDVTYVFWDEFLDDKGQFTPKHLDIKLFQALETIGRNRELLGKEPLKVVLCANSFSMNHDVLRTLNLIEPMREINEHPNEKRIYTDEERGIYLEVMENKKMEDKKSETRLYKLTKGTTFYDMALSNDFVYDYFFDVKRINIQELTPMCACGPIYFYKHKGKEIVYATKRKANCQKYDRSNYELFMKSYGHFLNKFKSAGLMLFQNYDIKLLTLDVLGGSYYD